MHAATREVVVGECSIRPDKRVVLDAQAIPELHAVLDRDAIADDDIVLDEAVGNPPTK